MFKNPKKVAHEFIEQHKLKVPVSFTAVAEAANIAPVFTLLPKKLNGITVPIPGQGFVTIINLAQPVCRRRFTYCHEVGHILLGHYDKKLSSGLGLYLETNPENPELQELNQMERDADIFAAELLIPLDHFKQVVKKIGKDNLEAICQIYGASKSCVKIKLKEAGL